MGASHSRALIRVYDVMQGRKMSVILDRNERLPALLRLINTEWSGDFRLRFLGADCPTSLYLYWLDSEVTHQSYVLAFEANPPGAMTNPTDPPFPPFPARRNGVFPTRMPPRLNMRSRVRTPRNSSTVAPQRANGQDEVYTRGIKRSRSTSPPKPPVIGKARPRFNDSRTVLGPCIPPQPVVTPCPLPTRPETPPTPFTDAIPEITPNPRVNYLLNRLEREMDADQRVSSPPLPTSSKATQRGIRRNAPSSANRPPPPPAVRRRYGPETIIIPTVVVEEDEDDYIVPNDEIPQLSNEFRLEQVIGCQQLNSSMDKEV